MGLRGWLRRRRRSIEPAIQVARAIVLSGRKIGFLDIGAEGGVQKSWQRLADLHLCDAYGIEPDIEFCRSREGGSVKYLPVAVGAKPAISELNITRNPQCSSFRAPNFEVADDYGLRDIFEIVRRAEIEITTVDLLRREGKTGPIDFMKIDVQGFEREVLEGAKESLSEITAIELEGHFRPLYRGQVLLPEIIDYLEDFGFALRAIRPQGKFKNEIVEVNAFFSVPPRLNPGNEKLALWERMSELG